MGRRYVGQQEEAAKVTAEGRAETQGKSKDGVTEEEKMDRGVTGGSDGVNAAKG